MRFANLISFQVSDPGNVQNAISEVVKDFGKIDVFIANAGEFMHGFSIYPPVVNLYELIYTNRNGHFEANPGANP